MSTRVFHAEDIELSMLNIEGGPGPGDLHAGADAGSLPNELSAAHPRVRSSASEQTRHEEAVALPPIDGGVQAWTFIFCSFVLESLVWGFPFRCVVAPQADSIELPLNAHNFFQLWCLSRVVSQPPAFPECFRGFHQRHWYSHPGDSIQ
jgi:hypothetical protein